jgi:hypothetical protein
MKYLILALLLSSCSIFKTSHKSDVKESESVTGSAKENKASELKLDWKGTSVTTEKADTVISIAGGRMTGKSTDLKTEPIIIEDAGFWVFVSDSAGTTKATAVLKPRKIPVKVDKRTEREESLQQTKTEKSDSTGEFKQKLKSETETKDREVKKTGLFPWWLWLILALIAAFLAWRKFRPF